MEFEELLFDFGNLKEGEKKEKIFKFRNTGDEVLVVDQIVGSCGCTVPEMVKKIFQPGEEGEVIVKYDSTGKKGKQEVEVLIRLKNKNKSGYPAIKELKLEAFIKSK